MSPFGATIRESSPNEGCTSSRSRRRGERGGEDNKKVEETGGQEKRGRAQQNEANIGVTDESGRQSRDHKAMIERGQEKRGDERGRQKKITRLYVLIASPNGKRDDAQKGNALRYAPQGK
ncbi:uncharacterized protein SPSK_02812 [Sporothrix schenckii 1099-18]|uniref:Uncharacterized protein n=1 Tax=Sporothrix schenckii 1099-18 TaxID=1397361 RepID=A0A0F2MCM9_SPOSC|nr:uncharacterized protein SPSK_02812 [Sporothrix schenckii 1099-18]KJR86585.1 hypothetical protein SPSK_02812 [Sporothrix schenckii 1099-18]